MKDTNAIEKALLAKIDIEIKEVVEPFIKELSKLFETYGGSSFYKITPPSKQSNGFNPEKPITCLERSNIRQILHEMIRENHENVMLAQKSRQLLAKLEIL